MITALKILGGFLVSLTAPIVTLFYRGGWYNTPDDPVSPRGMGEPFMQKLHAKVGPWLADYWWLAWRNRGYGYDYAMKPAFFKNLTSYEGLNMGVSNRRVLGVHIRSIWIEGYEEHTLHFKLFHVIVGYRLRPIWDEVFANKFLNQKIPFRPINMDARPIFSVRWGARDD